MSYKLRFFLLSLSTLGIPPKKCFSSKHPIFALKISHNNNKYNLVSLPQTKTLCVYSLVQFRWDVALDENKTHDSVASLCLPEKKIGLFFSRLRQSALLINCETLNHISIGYQRSDNNTSELQKIITSVSHFNINSSVFNVISSALLFGFVKHLKILKRQNFKREKSLQLHFQWPHERGQFGW